MTQYFRITAYHPTEDLSVIIDSYGMFEKLWEFSSLLISKGFKILEVGSDEKFLDVNIVKSTPEPDKLILRANQKGKPENIKYELNGIVYPAIKLECKIYIPDKNMFAFIIN